MLPGIVEIIPELNTEFKLAKRGYTLVIQEPIKEEKQRLICHIIAGNRLPLPYEWPE
jgi:hypothetical protein